MSALPGYERFDLRDAMKLIDAELGVSNEPANASLLTQHTTDLGNAERLILRHGADLHHCPSWRSWFCWDGRRWRRDTTGEVYRRAQETVRALGQEAFDSPDPDLHKRLVPWALKSESRERIEAMVALARSFAEVAVTLEQFDADPWLLNVENGTLDLRTGELREHRREDLITKLAPVEYDPEASLELWDTFLSTATDNDQEVTDFLQRAAGYALTGNTAEEVLFFLHGPTAAGKSTFIEALKSTLGEYAATADFEAFLARRDVGGPRNDIARLAGARFVASIEVDEGKSLAQGLLKMLTGGDTVTCRFLYQEAFEFVPQFKLFLAANHAPKVNADDTAMWRRILRVPFEHVIPEGQRDPKVKAALRNPAVAGPAVLAWAVEGCLKWQSEGLGVPRRVVAATNAYRESQDTLKRFLDDCCVFGPDLWIATAELRAAYEAWGRENGEKELLQGKAWGERLRARGCEPETKRVTRPGEPDRTLKARGWSGITLIDVDPEPEAPPKPKPEPEPEATPRGMAGTQSAPGTEWNGRIGNFALAPPHEGNLSKVPFHSVPGPDCVPNSDGAEAACVTCGGSAFCRGKDDGRLYCKGHAPDAQGWGAV